MRQRVPFVVFAIFVVIVSIVAINIGDLPKAQTALQWTMGVIGGLFAILSTFGLFFRAVKGEPLERQFAFVLTLLAGLLLVEIHWALAVVLWGASGFVDSPASYFLVACSASKSAGETYPSDE